MKYFFIITHTNINTNTIKMSQGLITEFIEEMHNQSTSDPTEDEYMNSYGDSNISLIGYPRIEYEKDREEIIKYNACKCCNRHQKNKVNIDTFNKTMYTDYEFTTNEVKDCECDCRHNTRVIADDYTDVYKYLCNNIEDTLKKSDSCVNMDYDDWLERCVDFKPQFKPLYCSKNAVHTFNKEKLLFTMYKKEVYYNRSISGSVMNYLYYTSYLVRYEVDDVEYIYSLELCDDEINLDYWHECHVYRVDVRDDDTETTVTNLIRLN